MARIDCVFDIETALGGDLAGPMFDDGTGTIPVGKLRKRQASPDAADELYVIARWNAGGDAPDELTGDVVFAMSQRAGPGQTAASPFKNADGRQLCHDQSTKDVQVATAASGNLPFYQWGPYTLVKGVQPAGSAQGKYEVTFVAELPGAAAGHKIQWSQDPEFDVDG